MKFSGLYNVPLNTVEVVDISFLSFLDLTASWTKDEEETTDLRLSFASIHMNILHLLAAAFQVKQSHLSDKLSKFCLHKSVWQERSHLSIVLWCPSNFIWLKKWINRSARNSSKAGNPGNKIWCRLHQRLTWHTSSAIVHKIWLKRLLEQNYIHYINRII